MDVLVVDIGGSRVKMLATGTAEPRAFDSGPEFTPQALVRLVRESTTHWKVRRAVDWLSRRRRCKRPAG